ncbi:MAG TPA: helix-turn-helix domain-containing protein [Stellaceae bacterium]|nr:helix-turn-helix domain-containing protein [Stellaceae bacterium]
MFRSFGGDGFPVVRRSRLTGQPAARSGHLDLLVALEGIGVRRAVARDAEIYGEGSPCGGWYKVISGTVRICKLMADGRRHIAEFCFAGDSFGLDIGGEHLFSAEAVSDAIVMRFPLHATRQLIDKNQHIARGLCELTLRGHAHAQTRMLLLGRMTAIERVASFLLELAERRDATRVLDLPMARLDIADYLGLTIETVCRVLSGFKRHGVIAIPSAHRIELLDRDALAAACDA